MENKNNIVEELVEAARLGMPIPVQEQQTQVAEESQEQQKPGYVEILSFSMDKELKLSWKKQESKLINPKMSQYQVFDVTSRCFIGGKYRPAVYSYTRANHVLNGKEMVTETKLRRIIEEAFNTRTTGRINEIILKLRQKQFICPGTLKDGSRVFMIGKAMHEFHDSFSNAHVHTCPVPAETVAE